MYDFHTGDTPLLVSIPHAGIAIPDDIRPTLRPAAMDLIDTDWHVPQLYNFLSDLGASVIAATHSRYVVDLNRPPGGESLYPGQATTGLAPTTNFDGDALYEPGKEPTDTDIESRVAAYWHPYHEKIAAELERLKGHFGYALLWDAHSIRSHVPRLFKGRLPDLNFGTNAGQSCDPKLTKRLLAVAEECKGFTHVLNGRFKGGFITRRYGAPESDVHAVQLELSQITYMIEEPPFPFSEERAASIRPVLRRLIETMIDWKPSG